MGRAEVFLHRTAMERATRDFTGLRCGQTVQRSCNFEGVQTSRFGGLESVQERTQAAAVVFRRTHQSLRGEMLDLADSARTQTNCQRTRPDFRSGVVADYMILTLTAHPRAETTRRSFA